MPFFWLDCAETQSTNPAGVLLPEPTGPSIVISSRERIITALQHEEPDRVPYDLGGTLSTGITQKAYLELTSYLGKKVKEPVIGDWVQQLVQVEEALLEELAVDTRGIFPKQVQSSSVKFWEEERTQFLRDEFGMVSKMPPGGFYYDTIKCPLEGDITIGTIDTYPWPNASDSSRFSGLRSKVDFFRKRKKLVVLGSGMFGGFFCFAARLRGFDNFYIDLLGNPDLACSLMDRLIELKMEFYRKFFDKVDDRIEVIVEADDLGAQKGLIISPQIYRKYVKPRQRKLYSFIKKEAKSHVYLLLHSCGSVAELIPDFIEVGVDILNPVQVSAARMDTTKLKSLYGEDITFWGGGCDTQRILPHGTVEEVKDEVKRRIDDLAPGGGFVFAPVHNIQPDVPPRNLMAMWATLQNYGTY